MRSKVVLIIAIVLSSCQKYNGTYTPPTPRPAAQPVLIKDIVVANLPSPYYHFEYAADGKISFVSFASDLTRYAVKYDGGRLVQMVNNSLGNTDKVDYFYDNTGKVNLVTYTDATGAVYVKNHLTYQGDKLISLERERIQGGVFKVNKTMTFTYQADGNLSQILQHMPALQGAPEQSFIDHFEQYDDNVNTDGFELLHGDFFDHLVLLPGVKLQINNPRKISHTGDGDNYTVNYTYTYNDRHQPLIKTGEVTIQTGAQAGQVVQIQSVISYY